MQNSFINIRLKLDTLDNYFIRRSIFESLQAEMDLFKGRLLDIGCGKMPYKDFMLSHSEVQSYVGLDIDSALIYDQQVIPDLTWNGIQMPIESGTFDTAIATEVLEHCFDPELTLSETYRVLDSNGVFFFTVPFLWNLHEVPHDAYRFTPFGLKHLLEKAGFQDVDIHVYGSWNSSLAQMLGLWVRRSGLHPILRFVFSVILYPVIWILYKLDRQNFGSKDYHKKVMIPGMYGTAVKRNKV